MILNKIDLTKKKHFIWASGSSPRSRHKFHGFFLLLCFSQLRKELEAFDPAFFEEIEDLKYNFQKSVERNVLYERQLRLLSKQFGVDVNIPTDDGS